MIIPTKEECIKILKSNNIPDNIIAHSEQVCNVALKVVDLLEKKGINVNRDLIAAGALLHDIKKINSDDHITEGYEYVKSLGYPEVANLVRKHGLQYIGNESYEPKTWEEKIVFYADKRVKGNKIVSVDERFDYIMKRYNKNDVGKEIDFTKKLEKELLGNEKIN